MTTIPDAPQPSEGRRDRYGAGVDRENKRLEEQFTDIRRREAAGTISVREAADARIDAMEKHLDALKRLRELYLGES